MTQRPTTSQEMLPMVGDVMERTFTTTTTTVSAFRSEKNTNGSASLSESDHLSTFSTTKISATTAIVLPLRPIQAVVGQAFPLVRTRRSYGRPQQPPPGSSSVLPPPSSLFTDPTHASPSQARTPAPRQATATAAHAFSAHVQPHTRAEGSAGDRENGNMDGAGSSALGMPGRCQAPMQAAGGSVQQRLPSHQWSAAEFMRLETGYYVAAVSPSRVLVPSPDPRETEKGESSTSAAATVENVTVAGRQPITPALTGEDFFQLLFQCLRSTVRRHQQMVLEVLLAHLAGLIGYKSHSHLAVTTTPPTANPTCTRTGSAEAAYQEAVALRERCVHGPNCAPFLFFLLEVFVSAGHPAVTELAATCLLLLLRGLPRGGQAGVEAVDPTRTLQDAIHRAGTGAAGEGVGYVDVALLMEAIAELGNPTGDAPEEEDGEAQDVKGDEEADPHATDQRHRGISKKKGTPTEEDTCEGERNVQDDLELPFGEVSELLRSADARYGLEQLGFTNKILSAMPSLLFLHHNGDAQSAQNTCSTTSLLPASTQAVADATQATTQAPRNHPNGCTEAADGNAIRHAELLFLELLLCGGISVSHAATCRRLAENPAFLAWMEGQLSAVVLGYRRVEELEELVSVLHHVAHVPAALRSLLRGGPGGGGRDARHAAHPSIAVKSAPTRHHQEQMRDRFHETWLLFFLYVLSTDLRDVQSMQLSCTVLWSMLLLRMCVRHGWRGGGDGLVRDLGDALMQEGMELGGALVLEMWFLQNMASTSSDDAHQQQHSSISATGGSGDLGMYFLDVARASLSICGKKIGAEPSAATIHGCSGGSVFNASSAETLSAQSFLCALRWISSAHFLATYLTEMRQSTPALCYILCGSAVETQSTMQRFLQQVLLDPGRIERAFARLTTPLLSASYVGALVQTGRARKGADAQTKTVYGPASASGQQVGAPGWTAAVRAVMDRWESSSPAPPRPSLETVTEVHEAVPYPADQVSLRTPKAMNTISSYVASLLQLALEAAALHANTRLVSTLVDVYPAVAADLGASYAGVLCQRYEAACLHLLDGATVRLQADELNAMSGAVQLLWRSRSNEKAKATGTEEKMNITASGSGSIPASDEVGQEAVMFFSKVSSEKPSEASPYTREARIGVFYLLHSIAISKHCLDVVPTLLPFLTFDLTTTRGAASALNAAGLRGADRKDTDDTEHEVEGWPAWQEQLALMVSLQDGIERARPPVFFHGASPSSPSSIMSDAASVPISGASRSWVLYPLYDTTYASKAVWASWLRRLFGVHHHVKDILGWDTVLSHTLLWTLAHRWALWPASSLGDGAASSAVTAVDAPGEEESRGLDGNQKRNTPFTAAALCELLMDLSAMLHDSGSRLTAAAARTLEISLASYADAASEAGLPLLLLAMLAYVGAQASAETALAALSILLVTPTLSTTVCSVEKEGPSGGGECTSEKNDAVRERAAVQDPSSTAGSVTAAVASGTSNFSYSTAAALVCGWLQTWSQARSHTAPSKTSIGWSLVELVRLLQLVAPQLRETDFEDAREEEWGMADSAMEGRAGAPSVRSPNKLSTERVATAQVRDGRWCARCLTDGLLCAYVKQRLCSTGAFSAMEKIVLRSTLEELDWFPRALWPYVKE